MADKCASVGCTSEATEVITYRYRGDAETSSDVVCTPCADGYARRPVLVGFTRQALA